MDRREELLEIFRAGVKAVQPDAALLSSLRLNGNALYVNGRKYDLDKGRLIVVGAGKGAAPLAAGLEHLLGEKMDSGLIAVKYGHGMDLKKTEIIEASHPEPDEAGEKAAREILEKVGQAREGDLVICLFTGGASALLPAPAHGLNLADLKAATSVLLGSGASIHEMNAIRKHLSRLAGGQLAKAANGAQVLSIIVSDVVGDDLGSIASGPTAPDDSTWQDCLAIIEKYGLAGKLPQKVMQVIRKGAAGELAETPKAQDSFFARVQNEIIASNAQALAACAKKAQELGFKVYTEPEPLGGEAAEAARNLVRKARDIAKSLKPGSQAECLLAGGETVVTISGNGLGGRNQEMALAASIEIADFPQVCGLFAGTDGSDGPTDAAGGFAFWDTAGKMRGRAAQYLAGHDSYHGLKEAGDLLVTGPTLTNVMDLAILLCFPPE